MSFPAPHQNDEVRRLRRELEELRSGIYRTPLQSSTNAIVGTPIKSTPISAIGKLSNLFSLKPVIHHLHGSSNNQITLTSSGVLVESPELTPTSTQLVLKHINGTQNNGQIIFIKPVKDKTLTLQSGGNILISSDVLIDSNSFAILLYEENSSKNNTASNTTLKISGLYHVLFDNNSAIKEPCRITLDGNFGTFSTINEVLTGIINQVNDGVTLNLNDRVLIKSETNKINNGIYKVSGLSDGLATIVRDVDFTTNSKQLAGFLVAVQEGTYADTVWMLVSNNPVTVGTSQIEFSRVGGDNLGNHIATTSLKMKENELFLNIAESTSLRSPTISPNFVYYTVPNTGAHWFQVGGTGSFTFGVTDVAVSSNIPILMNNNYLADVSYITFGITSGEQPKIDTSNDGKTINFYTRSSNYRLNLSENSSSQSFLELFGSNAGVENLSSASFKTVSSSIPSSSQFKPIGEIAFDARNFNNSEQVTYVKILAQAFGNTSGNDDGTFEFLLRKNSNLSIVGTVNKNLWYIPISLTVNNDLIVNGDFMFNNDLNMNMKNILNVNYVTFKTSSTTITNPKLDTNDDGTVFNFYTKTQTTSRMNLSENSNLNGTLEIFGKGTPTGYTSRQTPVTFKAVNTGSASSLSQIGDLAFDGYNSNSIQTTFGGIFCESEEVTSGLEKGSIQVYLRDGNNMGIHLNINTTATTVGHNLFVMEDFTVYGKVAVSLIPISNNVQSLGFVDSANSVNTRRWANLYVSNCNVESLTFAVSSGNEPKIDNSSNGKTFNFYTSTNSSYTSPRMNLSENSNLNGTLELFGSGSGTQAPASFKAVSTATAQVSNELGDFAFDGKNNNNVQITYADILGKTGDIVAGEETGAIEFNVQGGNGGLELKARLDSSTFISNVPFLGMSTGLFYSSVTAESFLISGSTVDPNTLGEFTINGSDVKVYSGGAVRNLSNIGSGSADNLGNHTATTSLKMKQNVIFLNTAETTSLQSPSSSTTHIYYTVPTSGAHWFQVGGTSSFTVGITDALLISNIPLYVLDQSTFLEGLVVDATGNNIDTSQTSFYIGVNGATVFKLVQDSVNTNLRIQGNSQGGVGRLDLYRVDSTPTDLDTIGSIRFSMANSSLSDTTYCQITGEATDITSNTEDGTLAFLIKNAGATALKTVAKMTGSGSSVLLDMNSNKIINVATPTSSNDCATKNYVDTTWTATASANLNMSNFNITNVNQVNFDSSNKIDLSSSGLTLTATSQTTFSSAIKWNVITTTSSNYTISNTSDKNHIIRCNASGNQAVNLPPISGTSGRQILVYKSSASSATVTVYPNGSEVIDGYGAGVGISWTTRYTATEFVSNGSTWMVLR